MYDLKRCDIFYYMLLLFNPTFDTKTSNSNIYFMIDKRHNALRLIMFIEPPTLLIQGRGFPIHVTGGKNAIGFFSVA